MMKSALMASRLAALSIFLVLLAACRSPKPAAPADAAPATQLTSQQVWQLVSMRDKPVSRSSHITTIVFNPANHSLSGSGPCNSFSASYHLDMASANHPSPFSISHLSSSSVLCPEPTMNAESRFFSLLSHVDALALSPSSLTLFQNNKATLQFELQ